MIRVIILELPGRQLLTCTGGRVVCAWAAGWLVCGAWLEVRVTSAVPDLLVVLLS